MITFTVKVSSISGDKAGEFVFKDVADVIEVIRLLGHVRRSGEAMYMDGVVSSVEAGAIED